MNSDRASISIADVPVAILAGGLATRLGSITQAVPKAMIDIDGRPFIDHQLELLRRNGIRRVVLCVAHLGNQIESHVGDGKSIGMDIRYSYDGPELAGTGGAIRRALPMLGDLFWVTYGDSYMEIDYGAILADLQQPRGEAVPLGMMTVIRNEDRWDRSNVVFENGRLTCYDKRNRTAAMRYIDYGVQLLRAETIGDIGADGRFDLSDLYHSLVTTGRMVGYEVFERFHEIGTPASLEETRGYLSRAKWKASA